MNVNVHHRINSSNMSATSNLNEKKHEIVDKKKKLSYILDEFYVLKRELENRERLRTTSNSRNNNIFSNKMIINKKYNLETLVKTESKMGLSKYEINGLKDFRLKHLNKNTLEVKDLANYMRYMIVSQVNRNFTKIERNPDNDKPQENLIVKPAQYVDLIKHIKFLLLDQKIPKYYSKLVDSLFKNLNKNKFYTNNKIDNKRMNNKLNSFRSTKSIKSTKFKNSDTNLSSINSSKTQLPEIKLSKNIYKTNLNVVEEENINLNSDAIKDKNESNFFLTTISNNNENIKNPRKISSNANLNNLKNSNFAIASSKNINQEANLITRNILDKSKNDVFISNNTSMSTINVKNKSIDKKKKNELTKDKKWKIPFEFEIENDNKNLIPNYLSTEPNFGKKRLATNIEICNDIKKIFPKSKINEKLLIKNLGKNKNSIFEKTFVLNEEGYRNKKDNRSVSDSKSGKSINDLIFNSTKYSKMEFMEKCDDIINNNNVLETIMNEEKSYDKVSLAPKSEFIEKDINGLNVDYLIKNKDLNFEKLPINKFNQEIIISKKKAEMIRIIEALNKLDHKNYSMLANAALERYDNLATELEIEGYEKPQNYLETKRNSNKHLGRIGNIHLKMKRILVDYTKTYKNNL